MSAKVRRMPLSYARKVTTPRSVAEPKAELNAEGTSSIQKAQRRTLIQKRIQESSASDPETMAALIRSWLLEDLGR